MKPLVEGLDRLFCGLLGDEASPFVEPSLKRPPSLLQVPLPLIHPVFAALYHLSSRFYQKFTLREGGSLSAHGKDWDLPGEDLGARSNDAITKDPAPSDRMTQ